MWKNISFVTPDIVFGMDAVESTGEKIKSLKGARALIITGPSVKLSGALDRVLESVKNAGIDFDVNVQQRSTPEPTTELAEEVSRYIVDGKFDVIVGLGGGSILDVAKMFMEDHYRRYPVLDDNRVIGVITRLDVLKALRTIGESGVAV